LETKRENSGSAPNNHEHFHFISPQYTFLILVIVPRNLHLARLHNYLLATVML